MQSLPEIPPVAVLSPFVVRILGDNPSSFRLQGSNTYLVGAPGQSERVLIDTSEGEAKYLSVLSQYLALTGIKIIGMICTHHHIDHIGGVNAIRKTLGYPIPVYKVPHPSDSFEPTPISDGDTLELAGVQLHVLFTPGHAVDHVCIFLPSDNNALFSGDNVLGHGSTYFNDYAAYMKSLKKMQGTPQLGRIYPGHGQLLLDGPRAIQGYILHREQREKQLLKTLQVDTMMTPKEITYAMYPGIPSETFSAAERLVQQYLEKLLSEGIIRQASSRYARL